MTPKVRLKLHTIIREATDSRKSVLMELREHQCQKQNGLNKLGEVRSMSGREGCMQRILYFLIDPYCLECCFFAVSLCAYVCIWAQQIYNQTLHINVGGNFISKYTLLIRERACPVLNTR